MGTITKVHTIMWVSGRTHELGYHVVRFQDEEGHELVACVFAQPGYVSVVRQGGAGAVYSVSGGAGWFEADLREEIRTGEGESIKAKRFRAAAESISLADPDWYGQELVVPVLVKGKSFNARYTIEAIGRNSVGRPVVYVRSSRGKLCDMGVPRVARYMGDPPRPRGRALDLEA